MDDITLVSGLSHHLSPINKVYVQIFKKQELLRQHTHVHFFHGITILFNLL